MTTPTPDRWSADEFERVAREITHGWMAHLGYTPEQIATADVDDPHTAECQFYSDSGWECIDENASSLHPVYDELCDVAQLVTFVLEHPALKGADHG